MYSAILIMLLPAFFALFKVFVEPKLKKKRLERKWNSNWGKAIFDQYDHALRKYNTYYKRLNNKGRVKFVKRTYDFVQNIIFYGKNGIIVTEEMKIVISSAAVQLTFGHTDYLFNNFRYIFVYPEPFYSKIHDQYLKGGTYPKGIIAISWDFFIDGYKDDEDGINLGLHEMAHTLLLQLSDDQFETYIDDWFSVSRKEFLNIREGDSTMFRSYAGTNRHEFLAVAIECFFEQPNEFKKKLPKIYGGLKVLLNQDPLNTNDNYSFKEVDKQKSLKELTKLAAIEKYI